MRRGGPRVDRGSFSSNGSGCPLAATVTDKAGEFVVGSSTYAKASKNARIMVLEHGKNNGTEYRQQHRMYGVSAYYYRKVRLSQLNLWILI